MTKRLALTLALSLAACSGSNDCPACMREKCEDLLDYCEQDGDCACAAECMETDGIGEIDGCLESCGLSERPMAFAELEHCVAIACPDSDECSTPGNYTPPDIDPNGSNLSIGGGSLADCSFDSTAYDPEGTVLQLESSDGTVCVRMERRDDGGGSLANTSWVLLAMYVGPLGEVAHLTDPQAMCWYSSHHNFRDWTHAWTGTRRHDLKLSEDGHGGPRTYELFTFEHGPLDGSCAPLADGTDAIGGIVELFPVNP